MIGITLSSIGVTLMRFRRAPTTGWEFVWLERVDDAIAAALETTASTTTAAAE
jgi:hypothetical protein